MKEDVNHYEELYPLEKRRDEITAKTEDPWDPDNEYHEEYSKIMKRIDWLEWEIDIQNKKALVEEGWL